MSESKHTPGPWIVNTDKDYENGKPSCIWTSKGPSYGTICAMTKEYPEKFNLANARLIAAAPDLLKVCIRTKAYLASLPGKYAVESRHLQEKVKAAIELTEKGKQNG